MNPILKKSIRNGIIVTGIVTVGWFLFLLFIQITAGSVGILTILSLFVSFMAGIQYGFYAFLLSLLFYYLLEKIRNKSKNKK